MWIFTYPLISASYLSGFMHRLRWITVFKRLSHFGKLILVSLDLINGIQIIFVSHFSFSHWKKYATMVKRKIAQLMIYNEIWNDALFCEQYCFNSFPFYEFFFFSNDKFPRIQSGLIELFVEHGKQSYDFQRKLWYR